jgi:hypothetical protein
VYGSTGNASVGASLIATIEALGVGVAVTLPMNPVTAPARSPAAFPKPAIPTYSTTAPSARTSATSPKLATSGVRPRSPERRSVTWLEPVVRGLTLTGAGRPVDGGRGRTCI